MSYDRDQTSNLQSEEKNSQSNQAVSNSNYLYPVSYQVPNATSNILSPIGVNNQPIIVNDHSVLRISQLQRNYNTLQPTIYFSGINNTRPDLAENYPTAYVVWHCTLLLFCALAQIVAEYFLVLAQSPMFSLTSGWYSGGLTIGCASLTLMTVGFRHPRLIRLVITSNVLCIMANTGFAITVSVFDFSETYLCTDDSILPCYLQDVYLQIVYLNMAKLIAGSICIFSSITYVSLVIIRMNKKSFIETRYNYINPNYLQPYLYQQSENQIIHY